MAQNPNDDPERQPAPDLPEWAQIRANVGSDDDGFEDFDAPAAAAGNPSVVPAGPARPPLPHAAQPPAQVPVADPYLPPADPAPVTPFAAPVIPIAPAVPNPAPAAPAAPAVPAEPFQPAAATPQSPSSPAPMPAPNAYPAYEPPVYEPPQAALPAATPSVPATENAWREPAPAAPAARAVVVPPAGAPRATGQEADWETVAAAKKRRTPNLLRFGGGRWKLIAVRAVTWTVLGLLFLLGILRIVDPNPTSTQAIVEQVKVELGRGDFPAERGEALASQFLLGYLTYSADSKQERARLDALTAYLADGVSNEAIELSANDARYTQTVLEGPILAAKPDRLDDTHVAYTFAVKISALTGAQIDAQNGPTIRWVYVTVAMVADAEGAVAVAGPPAFVPAPRKAADTEGIDWPVDETISEQALPFIKPYFEAWAASTDPESVNLFTRDESTYNATHGLGGTVSPVEVNQVAVRALPDGQTHADGVRRIAVTSVKWATPDGVVSTQTYRMVIVELNDKWYVLDIRGADFV